MSFSGLEELRLRGAVRWKNIDGKLPDCYFVV